MNIDKTGKILGNIILIAVAGGDIALAAWMVWTSIF